MTTRRFRDDDNDVDGFYADVADADLQPLWLQQGLMPGTPAHEATALRPFAWRWHDLRRLALRSGALIPIDRGGDRRVLALAHPDLGGLPYATRTLWGAVQFLAAGETAPAHRHTPGALRFVLEGEGVWTMVDGDAVAMRPGDLVLTPSWQWHEHHMAANATAPMLWFDGLDIPLVRALDAVFYEAGADQADTSAIDPLSAGELDFAAPGLVPDRPRQAQLHSARLAFRWTDTDTALDRALLRSPGYATLRYSDPASGRDVMPTLRCTITRLVPSMRTPSVRRAGSALLVCFRGAVTAVVGGRPLHLTAGDVLAVPSWATLDLQADEPTDLFSVSDAPVLEALALDRREVLPRHQELTEPSGL